MLGEMVESPGGQKDLDILLVQLVQSTVFWVIGS